MVKAATRTSRAEETREGGKRRQRWVSGSLLPVPNSEPGFSYRWVRSAMLGDGDIKNMSKRMREGWEIVKASEHPEVQVMSDTDSRFKDAIEIGGLILCKTPTENVEAREEHFEEVNDRQMASVDNDYLRENDPRMPLMKPQRRSRTSFGKGRAAAAKELAAREAAEADDGDD